jgi:hypothetical protein
VTQNRLRHEELPLAGNRIWPCVPEIVDLKPYGPETVSGRRPKSGHIVRSSPYNAIADQASVMQKASASASPRPPQSHYLYPLSFRFVTKDSMILYVSIGIQDRTLEIFKQE